MGHSKWQTLWQLKGNFILGSHQPFLHLLLLVSCRKLPGLLFFYSSKNFREHQLLSPPFRCSVTMATVKTVMAMVIMAATLGGKLGAAQVHHVVGGDRGWDLSSDVASWSSGRSFRVGDKIWFAYAAAQESIAEVNSPEEYESCDVSNPIRMYTDGIDGIPLDGEGIRYFVSGKEESCKNGLKLHVEVMPFGNPEPEKPRVAVAAAAPTTPSGSARLSVSSVLLLVGLWLCYMAI